MSTKFTTEYFIAKFEAIPDEKWAVGRFFLEENPECRCALGHCGYNVPPSFRKGSWREAHAEAQALMDLLGGYSGVTCLNNGSDEVRHWQVEGVKARILAALRDIQAKGATP